MMIKDLQRMADRLSDLIKAPVNIELNNCGGYDMVLWVGDREDENGIGGCYCNETEEQIYSEDYEPRTAEDEVWNELQTMIGLVEWLKKTGRLNENFVEQEAHNNDK